MLSLVAVAYLDRICIATAAPAIARDLHFDPEQMGFVFSAFTLAYALFEIPSGHMADRFGARIALTRIVVWWSFMTVLTGAALGFVSLLALRFAFGAGEAGVFPSMAQVYGRWLPARERGRAFGVTIATGAVAGAVTLKLVAYLLGNVFSWRALFAIFGGVGLVWVAAFLYYFRDDPREHPGVSEAELAVIGEASSGSVASAENAPLGELFRGRFIVPLCVMYGAAIYAWYFHLTWLPTYLREARGFDLAASGTMSALPLLGIALGVFVGGWTSDRLAARFGARARRWPGLVGFPLAALVTVLAATAASSTAAAWLLAASAGLGAAGVAPAWPVCVEVGGSRAGVLSGAMNMFGNLGGTLCPIAVGMCVKRLGSWPIALGLVSFAYLIAGAAWLAVDLDGTPQRVRSVT
ncbi:MAG TPA: MFS transporter [Polyangiaceae bacterium]|jgi:MFS family permease|nr:MFS transporter [Polyangiaceae bacterium]